LASLPIKAICPLHGPILNENIEHYVALYDKWSSYQHEDKGIVIAYTSMYGNTKRAALTLAKMLEDMSTSPIITLDLARTDWSEAIATAFRYDKLVLATTTYNSEIFPAMRQFIEHLVARNYKNRTLGFIENGSWAPMANKIMKSLFDTCKNISYINTSCSIRSALNGESISQLESMANELC
jgi:flavorubredoxin